MQHFLSPRLQAVTDVRFDQEHDLGVSTQIPRLAWLSDVMPCLTVPHVETVPTF